MEVTGALCLACATAGAGAATALFAPLVIDRVASVTRRVRLRARIAGTRPVNRVHDPLLRLVVSADTLLSAVPGLLALPLWGRLARTRVARRLAVRLRDAGLGFESEHACLAIAALAVVCAGLVGLLAGNAVAACVVAAGLPVVVCVRARRETQRRAERLREQLPSALSSISVSLGAGKSLQQALAYTSEHVPDPLSAELGQAVCDIEAGLSLEEAMAGLEGRTAVRELAFVSCALSIQQRTGGSLREILASASRSVTDAFDLKRTLRVQTAQTRLSARIVVGMPFVLLGVLLLVSPGYLSVFFRSPAGVAVLVVALLLDVTGIVAVRRLTDVEV